MSERRRNPPIDARTVVDQPPPRAGRTTQPIGGSSPPPTAAAGAPVQVVGARERSPASIPTNDAVTRIQVYKHAQPPMDPRLVLAIDPDSPRAASFRVLRHRLLEKGGMKTVVVSSPNAGEGKTTCAANLAIALSECDRARVLLLDCNLRAPGLATLFGFVPPECFAKQLARHRERPLEPWSVVEASWPWLHVAAVHPESASTPLLDGPAFEIAIERLKLGGYDYIVIDGPPVLGGADVNLIQDAVDLVVLTAWARKTRAGDLRRAAEQLGSRKLCGVALLDI